MARYSKVGATPRILLLILLILILILGGVIWLDYLGFLDAKNTVGPLLRLVGIEKPAKIEEPSSMLLLEEQRIAKLQDSITLQQEALDQKAKKLEEKQKELETKLQQLEEREQALEEREKTFNRQLSLYEDRKENLKQNAQYLIGMPPQKAVAIMEKMDDQSIIDLLRMAEQIARESGEQSMVAYWLSEFSTERAATIQRKMARKPESEGGG